MDGTRKKHEQTDLNLKGGKRWNAQDLLPLKATFNVTKKTGKCMFNLTMRRVGVTTVIMKTQQCVPFIIELHATVSNTKC